MIFRKIILSVFLALSVTHDTHIAYVHAKCTVCQLSTCTNTHITCKHMVAQYIAHDTS